MKTFLSLSSALLIGAFLANCAPVKFNKGVIECPPDAKDCNQLRALYDYNITTNLGQVDILFVDDNSASMSTEQKSIADRFPTFIQNLDNRNVDYRIGITTTDVTAISGEASTTPVDAKNGNLAFLTNGKNFISATDSDQNTRVDLFKSAIQRKETTDCEAWILSSPAGTNLLSTYGSHCPSQDERAVYAANLVVQKNPYSFIRPNSHLAVVIISDEEARSGVLALENNDLPDALINQVKSKFPNKTMSAHSIIIKDGDTACYDAQNNQTSGRVKGSYGKSYASLATKTNGVIGSVCESDYGNQLGNISFSIIDKVNEHKLKCKNPENVFVQFTKGSTVNYTIKGDVLKFESNLDPNTEVNLKYSCPQ